jgi:hypothetical protein
MPGSLAIAIERQPGQGGLSWALSRLPFPFSPFKEVFTLFSHSIPKIKRLQKHQSTFQENRYKLLAYHKNG